MSKTKGRANPALEACQQGLALVDANPLFTPLRRRVGCRFDNEQRYVSSRAWLRISGAGDLWLNPRRQATGPEWARLISHALIALGFGFIKPRQPEAVWELAVLIAVMHFCEALKIWPLPESLRGFPFPAAHETNPEALFRRWVADGHDPLLADWYYRYGGGNSVFIDSSKEKHWGQPPDWQALLAEGLSASASDALEQVAGYRSGHTEQTKITPAQRAQRQVMTSYPLLGALAASFQIEEDPRQCQLYDIAIAAIDVGAGKIWINPQAGLSIPELVFVFAHELLHAGLNHATRRRGRDPELWNVACDFVINGWLMEMQVGSAPALGLLYDPQFANVSAEDIYDNLAQNMRQARKLVTLRGRSGGDILHDSDGAAFVDAEAYCRRALYQGLERCLYAPGRGTLPAGLIEEVRSLAQPPIPWDVALAEWFSEHFPPPDMRRVYARPSRRQSATPDIPRPGWLKPSEEQRKARVFAVILDTSGSMSLQLLGKALGAIASYALAHEVFAVRFICCDAQAYDRGWVEPDALLHHFTLQGRGGTIIQPAVDLLSQLVRKGEFPSSGPLLLITDGYCEDRVNVAAEHAWLLPAEHSLPFIPRGKVFSFS